MTDVRPNLFTRDDTFFGVCQALADDIGINADWLRVAAAGMFFLAPVPVLLGYVALGLVIAAVRWLVPATPRPVAENAQVADAVTQAAQASRPIAEARDEAREPMALAA